MSKKPERLMRDARTLKGVVTTLNSIELLIITLVVEGLTTRYDLTVRAGMSVGATGPALKRMEKAGYLKSTLGPRRKQTYSVTKKGFSAFRQTLTGRNATFSWEEGIAGIESIPRTVLLLWIYSNEQGVREFLEFATLSLNGQAARKQLEADSLENEVTRLDQALLSKSTLNAQGTREQLVGTLLKAIKAKSDALFLTTQSAALESLFGYFPKLPRSIQSSE
jgi:DNA-binding PadR family transcriptional regulator